MKKKVLPMKHIPTLFLRMVVAGIGLVVLAICAVVLPQGIASDATDGYKPILLGLYVAAIPFFFALYQAMLLLNYIDTNKAFSDVSVRALTVIQYCAGLISLLFALGMPYIYSVADRDDAPGVVALGLVVVGASFVIATFAAVLQKLLQGAIDIKSENDLTV